MPPCLVHESLLCHGMQGVEWGESLPPVLLLHGTADTCALVSNATQFDKALKEAGAQVSRQDSVGVRGHGLCSCRPPALACVLETPLALEENPLLLSTRLALSVGQVSLQHSFEVRAAQTQVVCQLACCVQEAC